jgi:hypothetical protein
MSIMLYNPKHVMTMFAMGSKQELLGDMLCVMFLGIGIMAPGI